MVKRLGKGKRVFDWIDQKEIKIPPLRDHIRKGALTRLSVSKMQLFEKCPHAFKFYYIDGLKNLKDSEAMLNGKTIHDMFYYASMAKYPELIRLDKDYPAFEKDCENFIKFSRNRMVYLGTSRPYLAEYEIYDEELDVLLYIDRIDKLKGGIEIVDYKTGKVHGVGIYRFQLALYTYFVEKHLKEKVIRWGVFFSNAGRYMGEPVDRKLVNMIKNTIASVRTKMENSIKTGAFEKRSGPLCNWCNFRHFSLCDGVGVNKEPSFFGELDWYRGEQKEKKAAKKKVKKIKKKR